MILIFGERDILNFDNEIWRERERERDLILILKFREIFLSKNKIKFERERDLILILKFKERFLSKKIERRIWCDVFEERAYPTCF